MAWTKKWNDHLADLLRIVLHLCLWITCLGFLLFVAWFTWSFFNHLRNWLNDSAFSSRW